MGPRGKGDGGLRGSRMRGRTDSQEESGKEAPPDSLTPPPTEKSAQRPAGGVRHAVTNRSGGRRPPTPGNAGCPERRIVCLPFFLHRDPSPCYYFWPLLGFRDPSRPGRLTPLLLVPTRFGRPR